MRKPKYRAWDKEQEYLLSLDQLMDIRYNENWFKDNRDQNYINCIFYDSDLILEQFTGILDINEDEIYENDMIQWECCSLTLEGQVKFIDGAFCVCIEQHVLLMRDLPKLKIIGNIHEN